MKKIGFWYILFLFIIYAGMTPVLFYAYNHHWLEGCQEQRILIYETEWTSLVLSPFKVHTVLAGTSYVNDLGRAGDFINLAFGGRWFKHRNEKLASTLRQRDTIIFGVALHHFLVGDGNRVSFNTFYRRKRILKAFINPTPWWGSAAKTRLRLSQTVEQRAKEMAPAYATLTEEDFKKGLPYFRNIYIKHPNFVVVAFPVYPEKTVREKTALMVKVFEQSGLPFIDLSTSLDASDLYDSIHPNEKGAAKICRILTAKLHSFHLASVH